MMTTQQSAALKAARKEWHNAYLNVCEAVRRWSFDNIIYWSEVKNNRRQTVIELRRAWQAERTAAALAAAEAEVARLRAALEEIVEFSEGFGIGKEETMDRGIYYGAFCAAEYARAALNPDAATACADEEDVIDFGWGASQ
jgi:hypothetical protein